MVRGDGGVGWRQTEGMVKKAAGTRAGYRSDKTRQEGVLRTISYFLFRLCALLFISCEYVCSSRVVQRNSLVIIRSASIVTLLTFPYPENITTASKNACLYSCISIYLCMKQYFISVHTKNVSEIEAKL